MARASESGSQLGEARPKVDEQPNTMQDQSHLVTETVHRRTPATRLGSAARISFGLIWLIDAFFKWQPAFQHGVTDVLKDGATHQPTWLMPWFHLNLSLVALSPYAWAIASAIIETAIGIFLIVGFARKPTYIVGAVWSLLIWATAEGFGHPNAGMPWTDIGTAIMYTFIFLTLLALDAEAGRPEAGTRPFSLDAAIERWLPAWRSVAEMRR